MVDETLPARSRSVTRFERRRREPIGIVVRDDVISVPAWFWFYVQIGELAASYKDSENRLIIAVTMPTRVMAAALAATGFVIRTCIHRLDRRNPNELMAWLCGWLKPGTELLYREGSEKPAIVVDCDIGSSHHLKLQLTGRSSGIRIVPPLAMHKVKNLSLQIGADSPSNSLAEFITSLGRASIGSNNHAEFQLCLPSQQCLVLTQLNRFQREVEDVEFVSTEGGSSQTWRLQHVIAVDRFCGRREPARTIAQPTSSDFEENPLTPNALQAVVFDGPAGYLRNRTRFPGSNLVILIGLDDPRTSDALSVILEQFGLRTIDATTVKGIPRIVPAGVELLVYEDAK